MIAVLVLLMVGLVSGGIVCPGGTKCQDKNTCCQTKTGYACCHYPSAVCCPDKAHCCPQGYQCDLETQMCEKIGLRWYRIPFSPQVPAEEEEKRAPAPLVKSDNSSVSVVHCDNLHTCPDGTTCCRSPFGQWYCCLYSLGQCCRDGLHCCPFGYRCDSTSTICFRGSQSLPASPQIAAMQSNTIQVPAEEEEKRAPAPLVKSDNSSVSVVHCDNLHTCPDGTTCCRSPFGQWYCCLYSLGQCCRDGLHCCPFGYRCDSTSTICFRGAQSLPASPQIAAMQSNAIQVPAEEEEKRAPAPLVKSDNSSVSVVHCDNLHTCPDGTTCCRSPFGQWYCCLYSLGQCCRDGLHCCPFGYRCDSTSTICFRGAQSLPASPQIAAMQSNAIQVPAEEEEKRAPAPLVKSDNPSVSVVHCDNLHTCPDGTTCCRSPFGQWYCCLYSLGQCCRDGLHCCPFGYRCDSTSTICFRGAQSLPASPQIAAMQSNTIQVPAEEEEKRAPAPLVKSDNSSVSVVHCDNLHTCPDGTTCCRSPFGQWYCCLYSLGQCCRDGLHCCPFGYRCDSTSTICFRGAQSLPASPQIAAMQSNAIQTPRAANFFHSTDQCCQSETGCCPIGFHCDEESKACVRDFDHSSPLKSALNPQNQAGIIHCSDRFYCPAGNSCCKTLTGQWACCPYPLGQCCKDGKHCCEYGYDCNSTFTTCKRRYSSIPALLTKEALLL